MTFNGSMNLIDGVLQCIFYDITLRNIKSVRTLTNLNKETYKKIFFLSNYILLKNIKLLYCTKQNKAKKGS